MDRINEVVLPCDSPRTIDGVATVAFDSADLPDALEPISCAWDMRVGSPFGALRVNYSMPTSDRIDLLYGGVHQQSLVGEGEFSAANAVPGQHYILQWFDVVTF